jgi:hypothetical protein
MSGVLSRRLGRIESVLAEEYGTLTAEPRFRLVEAAFGRGDDEERDRLISTGRRIFLSISDHAPMALAFNEIALTMFIEVSNVAAGYLEKLYLAWGADVAIADEDDADEDFEEDAEGPFDEGADAQGAGLIPEMRARERLLDCALLDGFFLKLKVAAWQLFCSRIGVPWSATWQQLPGFRRVESALELAETIAFSAEGVARFRRRLDGDKADPDTGDDSEDRAEETAPVYSVEASASELEETYRAAVRWWDGAGNR